MKSKDTTLIAVLVVLAILVIFAYRSGWISKGKSSDKFTTFNQDSEAYRPYVEINRHIDSVRGRRHDAYRQTPAWTRHHAGAHLKPEDIAEAEREAWYLATAADNSGDFDAELAQESHTDAMQYHTTAPSIDYSGFITDLIVDPRTKDNHRKWVSEMKPWSGTPMAVDDMEEAVEASTDFHGLRRPQPVAQHNPLQVTEKDAHTFKSNAKFNFKG